MGAFRYEAVDARGKVQRGVIEADTARNARASLRERELTPVDIAPVAETERPGEGDGRRLGGRLSATQLNLVTRQLATLVGAGLTVVAALGALIEQSASDYERQMLTGVRAEMLAGHSLARALGRYPRLFSELYRALVHAGEESGDLAGVLVRLADYLEARQALRQKVILALLYPAIVTLVAFAVVIGLLAYVVPQVVEVFRQSHQALPLLTRGLIGFSDLLRHTAWVWIPGGIVAAFSARAALRREALRRRWHAWLLKVPLLGPLLQGLDTARLAATLAILGAGGVPLLAALQAGARTVENRVLREAVEQAARQVREGVNLARALGATRRFPPLLIHMIASGEASGRLDDMLQKAAAQQEQEVGNRISLFLGVLEPALILAMGGTVLAIVLAILLPIIEINQLVR